MRAAASQAAPSELDGEVDPLKLPLEFAIPMNAIVHIQDNSKETMFEVGPGKNEWSHGKDSNIVPNIVISDSPKTIDRNR